MNSYERVHEYLGKHELTTIESIMETYLEVSHDKPIMKTLNHFSKKS